jgi:hypothetical protein
MEEGMHQFQVLLVPTTHLAEVDILHPQLQVEHVWQQRALLKASKERMLGHNIHNKKS